MSTEKQFLKTNLVILFSPQIHFEALTWFAQKVEQSGLLIRFEPPLRNGNQTIRAHLTASTQKFISSAQELGIRKYNTRMRRLRSITTGTLKDFLGNELSSADAETLLTSAEKQFIVFRELKRMSLDGPEAVPGYASLLVPDSQPLFDFFLETKLILDFFPLHDETDLAEFGDYWIYSIIAQQPFDQIRNYFGDGITLYFTFLELYFKVLLVPAVLGLFRPFFNSTKTIISVSVLIVFCGAIVGQELWRRKCTDLFQLWTNTAEWSLHNPHFRRPTSLSLWQNTKSWLRIHVVSAGAIILVVAMTTAILFLSLWIQSYLEESWILRSLWTVVDALMVAVLSKYYRKFATWLTKWENHPMESDFEYYRVSRLVPFEFVLNFLPLFYFAFWLQDLNLLQCKVNQMMLILPLTSAFQETIFPLFLYKPLTTLKSYLTQNWPGLVCWILCDESPIHLQSTHSLLNHWKKDSTELRMLDAKDTRSLDAQKQQELAPYETTFDDYLEIYVQFGYVFLFAGISPYAAILALLATFFEIRADAFKLCKVNRRLLVKGSRDIGPWLTAFEILGVVAIMSNCFFLYVQPFGHELPPFTLSKAVWTAILFFGAKFCLYVVPDANIPLPRDL